MLFVYDIPKLINFIASKKNMIKRIIPALLLTIIVASCSHKKDRPTTAIDTGRDFIRATLDGNFEDAEPLLYNDTLNVQFFDSYKMMYYRLPDDYKQKYKDADYVINKYTDLNDSVSVINYSNTYMKQPQEIKVVNKNGKWQIDFKYTVSGASN
jgi:hypothetical protein